MFSPLTDYPTPAKGWQQRENRLPNRGDSVWTLVAAARYHQDLDRAADLPLSQPCFGSKACIGCGRKRFPKIERVPRAEFSFVERSQDRTAGDST
jgi:hypothetical protein